MAKDLPYFKFYCSEWTDGDITLENYETQGIFVNICSYYWSNECNITLTKLKKKFRGNDELINNLLKEELIKKDEDENISISFLDEQRDERSIIKEKNSIAGKASAIARKRRKLEQELNENSTDVEITLNENPTIKKRREEKREDNNNTPPDESGLLPTNPYPKKESSPQEEKKEKSSAKKESFDWNELRDFINDKTGRNFKVINQKVRTKYNARLKEGYTKQDIGSAITNAAKSEHHKESGCQHLTPEFFSRADKIDMYASPAKNDSDKIVAKKMNS